MPSSDHLRPRLNREILGRVLLFLWFRSIGAAKSDLNLCANSVNLFLREPLLKQQVWNHATSRTRAGFEPVNAHQI